MLKELFTTDIGLMSLAVIVTALGIALYLAWMLARKSSEGDGT